MDDMDIEDDGNNQPQPVDQPPPPATPPQEPESPSASTPSSPPEASTTSDQQPEQPHHHHHQQQPEQPQQQFGSWQTHQIDQGRPYETPTTFPPIASNQQQPAEQQEQAALVDVSTTNDHQHDYLVSDAASTPSLSSPARVACSADPSATQPEQPSQAGSSVVEPQQASSAVSDVSTDASNVNMKVSRLVG
jgi:hypothetical protein